LSVWSCLLALVIRILLPILHCHHGAAPVSDSASDPAHAARVTCHCGHHHSPMPGSPTADSSTDAPDRATDDAGTEPAACLACEIEQGVPGAPPAAPMHLPRRGPTTAPPVCLGRSAAIAMARGYACRAPPGTHDRTFACG
jgi:hypothetical protein